MDYDFDLGRYTFTEHKAFDLKRITLEQEIRELCKQNVCRQYDANHMCPPAIKGITEWKAEIFSHQQATLVTKAYPTNGPFDMKTWISAGKDFQKTLVRVKKDYLEKFPGKKILLLGAGACRLCETCTYCDGQPCRLPEDAFPSLEACGINVMTLSQHVGVKYNNGKNTVTYIGAILLG